MTRNDDVTWLFPEFQGREHELVSFTEFVQMAAVDRQTARKWMLTGRDFPPVIKEVPVGNGPVRYFVAADVAHWLIHERPRQSDPTAERARLRVVAAGIDEEITALQEQLRHKVSVRDQITTALEG